MVESSGRAVVGGGRVVSSERLPRARSEQPAPQWGQRTSASQRSSVRVVGMGMGFVQERQRGAGRLRSFRARKKRTGRCHHGGFMRGGVSGDGGDAVEAAGLVVGRAGP